MCKALTGLKMGVPASIFDFLLLCKGLSWLFNVDRRANLAATRPNLLARGSFPVLGYGGGGASWQSLDPA